MDWAKLLSHSKKWYLPAGRSTRQLSAARSDSAAHALRLRSLRAHTHVWLPLAATSSCHLRLTAGSYPQWPVQ